MIRLSRPVIAIVVLALAAGGCGGDDGDQADSPQPTAGSPTTVAIATPDDVTKEGRATLAAFNAGKRIAPEAGCLACHVIGDSGNDGPGPALTEIGARMSREQITQALIDPRAPMPSFQQLRENEPKKFDDLVEFLSQLK